MNTSSALRSDLPPAHPRAAYRADIDGLRALAVSAVVLFHAGVTYLPGGFAGVDVFFVISGFLIGGIVGADIAGGTFSYQQFYARRARRILPALIGVTIVTFSLGVLLLGPRELADMAISQATALGGVSNVWFWHTRNYFSSDAKFEPFLMTWSLGIEEQFYLLLPPLLILLKGKRQTTALSIVLVVAALSLGMSVAGTPIRPVESFYLLPTRAWELGAGVALALSHHAGWHLPKSVQQWLSVVGATTIAFCFLQYDETIAYPGYAALLPVLATVALILTPQSFLNVIILGSRPFVFVGLMSYSWYLWHWPLLALVRICAAVPVAAPITLAVGLGSLLPAYLSWRYIERPFRHHRNVQPIRSVRNYTLVVASLVVCLVAVVVSNGLSFRVGPVAAHVDRTLAQAEHDPCLVGYGVGAPNFAAACVPVGARPKIALIGDSHAGALGPALRAIADARGYDLVQMTAASCPPLQGATLTLNEHPGAAAACARYNRAAMQRLVSDGQIHAVVMASFWQSQFSSHAIAIGDKVIDLDPREADRPTAIELPIALTRTVRTLAQSGKRVLVLGDVPWLEFNPARHVQAEHLPMRAALEHMITPDLATLGGQISRRFVAPLNDEGSRIAAASVAGTPSAQYIDVRRMLCNSRTCRTSADGVPYFIDQQHLSRAGADVVSGQLAHTLFGQNRVSPTLLGHADR